MSSLGQGADWDPEEFDSVVDMIAAFKFGIFVTVLESKYAKDLDEGGMREAIRDIHDYFVKDAVKKGHLGKKMDLLPAYREHYFVLQPQVIITICQLLIIQTSICGCMWKMGDFNATKICLEKRTMAANAVIGEGY